MTFVQALQVTVQAWLIFQALCSPYVRLMKQAIAKIRAAMGEEAFLAQWQAISGHLPLPSRPAQNEEQADVSIETEEGESYD
jgi:hypothetical protein